MLNAGGPQAGQHGDNRAGNSMKRVDSVLRADPHAPRARCNDGVRRDNRQAMGRWADGQMGGWADGRMGRWADGQMGRWADGRMGGWADGRSVPYRTAIRRTDR